MAALAEPVVGVAGDVFRTSWRIPHLWLSLLSFCLLRGTVVALVFSMILVGGAATLAGGQARHAARSEFRRQAATGLQTFSGMVTDSNCRARHNQNSNLSSTECAQVCIRGGAKNVLVDGEKILRLEGHPGQLQRLAGQRVEIRGTRTGDCIQVDSILPQ